MKRIPRRMFTEEFKREAIKLVTDQGLTLAEAARKLEIDPKSVKTWIAQQARGELKPSFPCAAGGLRQANIHEQEGELLG